MYKVKVLSRVLVLPRAERPFTSHVNELSFKKRFYLSCFCNIEILLQPRMIV